MQGRGWEGEAYDTDVAPRTDPQRKPIGVKLGHLGPWPDD